MIVRIIRKNKLLKKLIYRLGEPRGRHFADLVTPYLDNGKLLDIGVGTGNVSAALMSRGYNVTPLDIEDLSFTETVRPALYDGGRIPHYDKSYSSALLLTVLHHTKEPEKLLEEAARVSSRVIIIEDIYSNVLGEVVTKCFDSLLNLEFINHPHSNKTDSEWKKLFRQRGLALKDVAYARSFVVFKHAIYVLETN